MSDFKCSQCEFSFSYDPLQNKAIFHCPHCSWIFDKDQCDLSYPRHEGTMYCKICQEPDGNFDVWDDDCICKTDPKIWDGKRLFLVVAYFDYEPCSHMIFWAESEEDAIKKGRDEGEIFGEMINCWDITKHFSIDGEEHYGPNVRLIF